MHRVGSYLIVLRRNKCNFRFTPFFLKNNHTVHAPQDNADLFFPSLMQLASEILKSCKLLVYFHGAKHPLKLSTGIDWPLRWSGEAERKPQTGLLTISPFNVVIVTAKFAVIQRYLEQLYKRLLNQKKSVRGSEKWLLSISLVISTCNNIHISNHLIIYRSISLVNTLISALTFQCSPRDWELFSL